MLIPQLKRNYKSLKNEISYHLLAGHLSQLRKIVIKITLQCNANCIACKMRRGKYEVLMKKREKTMQLADYEKLLNDAKTLGLERVVISGGEPTISENFVRLIKNIKQLDLYCTLNTNGFNLSNMTREIIDMGVDEIIISLDSLRSEIHDWLRRCSGLWKRAVDALERLQILKKERRSKLKITIRSILTKYFLEDLAKIIDFAQKYGIDSWQLDYVEADYESKILLPSEVDIQKWRMKELPQMIQIIKSNRYPIVQRNRLIACIKKIFHFPGVSNRKISEGIYRRKDSICDWPKYFALIYPNGDVWPCIGLDYRKDYVMGNLFKEDIKSIFRNKKYYDFRKESIEWCKYCPNSTIILEMR